MNFNFNFPTKVYFGENSLNFLISVMEQYRKIGVVYDFNLKEHNLLKFILNSLEKKSDLTIGEIKISEPDYNFLDKFRKNFMASEVEAIIGIGGGSTLDTAKAIAVLVNNEEPAIFYRGFDKMTEPVLPVYAIPTTAGTGSEITPNASFVDSEAKKKLGINGEAIRPKAAFLHPGFIETCPEKPASYAAIDALIHAIEAFSAKSCTLPGKMFAITALDLIINNITKAVKNRDKEAIENLFWGSTLAAAAMMHSGTGPIAALSYPLGVHCKVPHGLAGAVFLSQVVKFNIDNGFYEYGNLPFLKGESLKERSLNLLERLEEILDEFNIPKSIKEVGFKKDLLDVFLKDLDELNKAIIQNPVKITKKDLKHFFIK